jgi:hypothetical protein
MRRSARKYVTRSMVPASDCPRHRGRRHEHYRGGQACDPAELPDTMLITAVTLGELSYGPHATGRCAVDKFN